MGEIDLLSTNESPRSILIKNNNKISVHFLEWKTEVTYFGIGELLLTTNSNIALGEAKILFSLENVKMDLILFVWLS